MAGFNGFSANLPTKRQPGEKALLRRGYFVTDIVDTLIDINHIYIHL